mmetsp:Transcript_17962/g.26592  ORF Transcript_17962/g.26592 Transcript_17962/m.26592 type:complete len:428 (-) Transcript_17962:3316-4599(-)
MMFQSCRNRTSNLIRCTTAAMAGYIYDTNKSHCQERLKILIVGSGLTGSLTAFRIQQRLNNSDRLDIVVAERATYAAGRFGATASYQNSIADIGAQVLSTVNPKDYRAANEGHGISFEDTQLADTIVQRLVSKNLLLQACDTVLAETEERMIFEGLWKHYFAVKGGMTQILQFLLHEARVQSIFGLRIDSLRIQEDDSISVQGMLREKVQQNSAVISTPFNDKFDFVIICVPAPDALKIKGVATAVSSESLYVLEHVGYDKRICEAHFFSNRLSSILETAMGHRVEQNVEDLDNCIEYVAWQNPKRSISNDEDTCCTVVFHSQTGFRGNNLSLESINETMSELTGLTPREVNSLRLKTKRICWDTSQMITPMEAIISDPPARWQCLQSERNGRLILAGDYMTQSSFLGCVATADAAARAVEKALTKC